MNRFLFAIALSAMTIIPPSIVSQPGEMKHTLVPMPKGLIRVEALNIDKEWAPPVVHLKGNALVRIYTANKDPRGAIIMRADEVDLNQTTGEISPRGNVRLTVEDIK